MDLPWPLHPDSSVNGDMHKDTYLSVPKEMRLPSTLGLASLITEASRRAWLFSCDESRAYRQLPLDPADWPLVCFQEGGRYFMDASLPFGLRWAEVSCQATTSIITGHLNCQGFSLLNYIDDFGGEGGGMQATLGQLGLVEAKHKAPPPLSVHGVTGAEFKSVTMMITIPQLKLVSIADMVAA